MTAVINKRKIRAGEDVDWITERMRCNGQGVLYLLRERVELDVKRANKIREGLLALDVNSGPGCFTVCRSRSFGQSHCVVFALRSHDGSVLVDGIGPDCPFTVTHEWDEATSTCKLIVEEKPVEPWQVSQRALTPLISPDPLTGY